MADTREQTLQPAGAGQEWQRDSAGDFYRGLWKIAWQPDGWHCWPPPGAGIRPWIERRSLAFAVVACEALEVHGGITRPAVLSAPPPSEREPDGYVAADPLRLRDVDVWMRYTVHPKAGGWWLEHDYRPDRFVGPFLTERDARRALAGLLGGAVATSTPPAAVPTKEEAPCADAAAGDVPISETNGRCAEADYCRHPSCELGRRTHEGSER